jgi:hypothetical protein
MLARMPAAKFPFLAAAPALPALSAGAARAAGRPSGPLAPPGAIYNRPLDPQTALKRQKR